MYLDENLGALTVRLTPEELARIKAVLPAGAASDDRYLTRSMETIDR